MSALQPVYQPRYRAVSTINVSTGATATPQSPQLAMLRAINTYKRSPHTTYAQMLKIYITMYRTINMCELFNELGTLHAAHLADEATSMESTLGKTWNDFVAVLLNLVHVYEILSKRTLDSSSDSSSESDG